MNKTPYKFSIQNYYEDHVIIDVKIDKKILVPVTCSQPGCEEKGMAYVDPNAKESKPHYCNLHNPMIVRNFSIPKPRLVKSK